MYMYLYHIISKCHLSGVDNVLGGWHRSKRVRASVTQLLSQYPPADSIITAPLNHSCPVIHLVVFLISDRGISHSFTDTQNTTERVEETNKHGPGLAPSARSGEVYVTLFVHTVFLWANVSMYSSENSHKATSNADLASRIGHLASVGQQVLAATFWHLLTGLLSARLSSPDCHLLGFSSDCLSGLFRTFLPSSTSGLAHRPFVWVSRQNRQRDRLTGTHTHQHNECPTSYYTPSLLTLVIYSQ